MQFIRSGKSWHITRLDHMLEKYGPALASGLIASNAGK
jgi:hypothetical protein